MVKKKKELTIEELINQALVPESEWPYELPDGWVWVRLGAISKFIDYRGKTPKKIDSGIRLITAKNIKKGYISKLPEEFISEEEYYKFMVRGIPEFGDVIITTEAPLGNVAQLNIKEKYALAQRAITISISNEKYNKTFLKYYLLSPKYQQILNQASTGTTVKGIKSSKLKLTPIPLPPLSTQKQIVEKLESMLSKIHEAKKLLKEARETFKNRKSAILHKAFTGELTKEEMYGRTSQREDNFKGTSQREKTVLELLQGIIDERRYPPPKAEASRLRTPPKRGNSKKGAKTIEEMLVPESEWPYELPDGWVWVRLGSVVDILRGGSPRPIQSYLTTENDGINWIKIGDTKNNDKYIYKTKQKIIKDGIKKSRFVEEGDFLLSNSMSFGRPYIMKTSGCIHDGWLLLKNYQKVLLQDYFYQVLTAPNTYQQFSESAKGSTVKNLNIEIVKTINIPLPPLSTQKQIVEKLESILKKEEQAMELLNIENDLDLLEKSILAKAFRGELTKGNKLSSEETASELLERVLREKHGLKHSENSKDTEKNAKIKRKKDGRLF